VEVSGQWRAIKNIFNPALAHCCHVEKIPRKTGTERVFTGETSRVHTTTKKAATFDSIASWLVNLADNPDRYGLIKYIRFWIASNIFRP